MSKDIRCSLCKYKMPKQICGLSQSPYYQQKVKPDDSCNFFLDNPAQSYYNTALNRGLDILMGKAPESERKKVIQDWETAIKLGLPDDDEMSARFFLGETYLFEFGTDEPNLSNVIDNLEKAVLIDFRGGYGFFSDPINRARLQRLDGAYSLKARSIKEKEGVDATIVYMQNKLQIFDYLPSTPMLNLLNDLGIIYREKGNKELSAASFNKVLSADVVNPGEPDQEAGIRQMAKGNLEKLKPPQSKFFGITVIFLVIIGILTAIAVPNFLAMQKKAKEASIKAGLHTLDLALEEFALGNASTYPETLTNSHFLADLPNGQMPPNIYKGEIPMSVAEEKAVRHPLRYALEHSGCNGETTEGEVNYYFYPARRPTSWAMNGCNDNGVIKNANGTYFVMHN